MDFVKPFRSGRLRFPDRNIKAQRRSALLGKIPYYTTIPGAIAAIEGIIAYREGNLDVRSVQDDFKA